MSDKEYGGYSLYRGGPANGPRFVGGAGSDWLNPFAGSAMFGGGAVAPSRGSGFFRGAPVVEAPRQQHLAKHDRVEGISKQVTVPLASPPKNNAKVPCSNVPTRTLRRVNAFASRDWSVGIMPVGIMPIAPIDAELHHSPTTATSDAPLVERHVAQDVWSTPVDLKETAAKKNIWAFTSNLTSRRAPVGIKAVGESDGDSGPDDDKDDDTWLNDLKETMQLAMQENDEKSCFHFEWLAHGSSSAAASSSTPAPPKHNHHSIFHKH